MVPVADLREGPALRQRLEAYADSIGSTLTAPVASMWLKHHNAALLPAVLGPMTLRGIGLGASPASILFQGPRPHALVLHDREDLVVDPDRFNPRLVHQIHARRSVSAEVLRRHVLRALFGHHLEPLIHRLKDLTDLPTPVAWANAANLLTHLYARWAQEHPSLTAVEEDRRCLLEAPTSAWGAGANPLRDSVREVRVREGQEVFVRRTCCLRHRIPLEPCGTCPLRHHADPTEVPS